jgi:nucleotide-binding universal stress UspA family protein
MVTIFHPSDFSPASESAFVHALKIALVTKAHLQVMHVAHSGEDVHWTDFPRVRESLERWKILPEGSRKEDVASLLNLHVEKIIARAHDPVQSILRHVRDSQVDLVVLATHQREGLARWLHGSVAEPVARQLKTMTLFVPSTGKGFVSLADGAVTLEKVLVPIDRIPDPQSALDDAVALVSGLGCEQGTFVLVHVGAEAAMPTVKLPQREGWTWQKIIREGGVVEEIHRVERDWSADLMVLATQGHRGFMDALRGSTTERVLRGARCPVLAVPMASEKPG